MPTSTVEPHGLQNMPIQCLLALEERAVVDCGDPHDSLPRQDTTVPSRPKPGNDRLGQQETEFLFTHERLPEKTRRHATKSPSQARTRATPLPSASTRMGECPDKRPRNMPTQHTTIRSPGLGD